MSHSFLIFSEDHSAKEMEALMKAEKSAQAEWELAVEEEPEGTRSLDPTVLVALVGGGATVLSAVVTGVVNSILTIYKNKAERSKRQIVLKGKNGRELSIPADTTAEKIQEYMKLLKELEIDELEYVSVEE